METEAAPPEAVTAPVTIAVEVDTLKGLSAMALEALNPQVAYCDDPDVMRNEANQKTKDLLFDLHGELSRILRRKA